MHGFRLALIFLTLLPLAPKGKISDKDWAPSIKFFPTVGLVFGLLSLIIFKLFNLLDFEYWEQVSWLFAFAVFCGGVFLSGGLHLDGLMDSFDGIGASKATKEETIEVMKDSCVGAFGAAAAFILLIGKIISLAHIDYDILIPVLIITPMLSRALVVAVMSFQKLQGGKARTSSIFEKNIRVPFDFVMSILQIILVLAFFYLFAATFHLETYVISKIISLMIFSALISYAVFVWLAKKLFGHSGDSYGAGLEISETISYFLFALAI